MFLKLKIRWSTGEETEENEEPSYDYSYLVLDIKDIRAFNAISGDPGHTVIRTYQDENYYAQIPFDVFEKVFIEFSGNNIHTINVHKKENKKNPPKKDDKNDDLFLE